MFFDKNKTPQPQRKKPIALRISHWRNDELNHGKINKITANIDDNQLARIIAIVHETERNHAE